MKTHHKVIGISEEAEASDDKDSIFIDLDIITAPLELRSFRPGDRIRPLGMKGSKKLKDYFIDKKVPRYMRGEIPLVISGDDVLWVAGYRKCGAAHANSKSIRVLKLTKV